MQKLILPFGQLAKKDVGIAGGKGASLGEMTRAKIPVPPGFVILAVAFDRFLHETDLEVDIEAQLKKVKYDEVSTVERASRVIRDTISKAKMPKDLQSLIVNAYKNLASPPRPARRGNQERGTSGHKFYVAVRSSATAEDGTTASWAGELETYLNTTEKSLLKRVKDCWSSLFTPRAIFYRHEKKMHKAKVSVAVVVQAMVQSEIAGIAFTVHPVTKDKKQMIIEAGYGLGEAVVSGQITPDSYVLDKSAFTILDINIAEQARYLVQKPGGGNVWKTLAKAQGSKQKLTGRQIIELAKICLNIEKHYRFPCDIEWAYAGGKFYITQSRPITTL